MVHISRLNAPQLRHRSVGALRRLAGESRQRLSQDLEDVYAPFVFARLSRAAQARRYRSIAAKMESLSVLAASGAVAKRVWGIMHVLLVRDDLGRASEHTGGAYHPRLGGTRLREGDAAPLHLMKNYVRSLTPGP
jgi:hypothetical protein